MRISKISLVSLLWCYALPALSISGCKQESVRSWGFEHENGVITRGVITAEESQSPNMIDIVGVDATGVFRLKNEDQVVLWERTIKNGTRHGKEILRNSKGQIIMEAMFDHNELHGQYLRWHENGTKASDGHYTHGLENGVFMQWHKNGQLKIESTYHNGLLEGRRREWTENGALLADAIFANHKPVDGTVVIEQREGSPPLVRSFKDGKPIISNDAVTNVQ